MISIFAFLFCSVLAFLALPDLHFAGIQLFLALCNIPGIICYIRKEFNDG